MLLVFLPVLLFGRVDSFGLDSSGLDSFGLDSFGLEDEARGAGSVVSSNANGMSAACKRCIDGSEKCTMEGITEENGIVYENNAEQDECTAACLPWIPEAESGSICKCWIDCNKGTPVETVKSDVIAAYINSRVTALIPAKGSYFDKCKAMDSVEAAEWLGNRPGNRKLWTQETAQNFLISFWYKPNLDGGDNDSYKAKGVKSLLYKGPETPPSARPVDIKIDTESGTPALVVTVAGVDGRVRPTRTLNLKKQQFTFIAVTKKGDTISVWTNDDDNSKAVNVLEFSLKGAQYLTSVDDRIVLVAAGSTKESIPHGWMGKLKYVAAHAWDPSEKTTLWAQGMDAMVSSGPPTNCGA